MATNDGINNPLAGSTGSGQYVGDTSATLVTPASLGVQQSALDMNSNQINNLSGPTASGDAATKGYVDAIAFNTHPAADFGTTANLAGYTYDNGTAGVGATLTAGGVGAFSTDGQSPALNDRILVKDQSTQPQNGIYTLTTVGDGATAAVLTRATDYDEASDMEAGDEVAVVGGDTLAATKWMMTQTAAITVGTTDITFAEIGQTDALLRSNNLSDVDSASTSRTNLGLDTMATQAANNVAITGGTIDGATVGATTPAAGTFTSVTVQDEIVHDGDTNNKIVFGTDTQDYQTGGSSRIDLSNTGVRMGGANSRVTTILDEDNMASDSATALATQQSIKAYVDSIGGAKILQIKQATTATEFSTSSVTLVDVTNQSVSITPSSTSNDILVMVSARPYLVPNAGGDSLNYLIIRDVTGLSSSSAAQLFKAYGTDDVPFPFSFIYVDVVATTSPLTYKVQMAVSTAAATGYWITGNARASIIVAEIDGGLD